MQQQEFSTLSKKEQIIVKAIASLRNNDFYQVFKREKVNEYAYYPNAPLTNEFVIVNVYTEKRKLKQPNKTVIIEDKEYYIYIN